MQKWHGIIYFRVNHCNAIVSSATTAVSRYLYARCQVVALVIIWIHHCRPSVHPHTITLRTWKPDPTRHNNVVLTQAV